MKNIRKNKLHCNECKYFSQILRSNIYIKFYWIKECTQFNCRLSEARKKCQGKYMNKHHIFKNNMKVVKMIAWKDAEKYSQCDKQNNYKDFWDCVRKFLVEKNIKFSGSWHQRWEYGVPLIEHEGKLYAFAVSARCWGQIMAEAFYPNDKSLLAHVRWFYWVPRGENITVDENKDPSLSLN